MSEKTNVQHPYVDRSKAVSGGEPVIRGTRFSVRAVVEYILHQGMTPEELVREWKHLSLAKVYDALSYYHDHKRDIDTLIRQGKESVVRRKKSG